MEGLYVTAWRLSTGARRGFSRPDPRDPTPLTPRRLDARRSPRLTNPIPDSDYAVAGCLRGIARFSHPPLERLEPHTEEPAISEQITHVAFDMHQASITADLATA